MTVLELGLVFLGCAMLYFAPAMAVGATQASLPVRRALVLSALSALVQAAITMAGMLLSWWLRQMINDPNWYASSRLIVFFLALLSVYMLVMAAREEHFRESLNKPVTPLKYARLALVWFLPVLCAGMLWGLGLAFSMYWVLFIFACAFLISVTGLLHGYWRGYRFSRAAYAAGGLMLLAAAVLFLKSIQP